MQHQLTRGQADFVTRSTPIAPGERLVEGAIWFELSTGVQIGLASQLGQRHQGDHKITDVNQVAAGVRSVRGIASSTGVDSHGTEMSVAALEGMAAQFRAGVAYAPIHEKREWLDIVGRTTDAEISQVERVANASDPEEAQYTLTVSSDVYLNKPLAQLLVDAIERGDPVGQSIGGWFTKIRIHEDADGVIQRIIVDEVQLDHLAATRTPSNADSVGLALRATVTRLSADDLRLQTRSLVSDLAQRHILSVDETEESYVVTYAKSARVEESDERAGDQPESMDTAMGPESTETGAEGTREDSAEEDASNDSDAREGEPDASGDEVEAEDESRPRHRTVIDYQALALAEPETEWVWDTDQQDAVLFAGDAEEPQWDLYRMAHTWYDPPNAEAKLGYKLPIARMIDGELRVVLRALSAVVGALNGARGGVDIPDEDRQGVYDHVVRYFDRFGVEPPPLRAPQETSETELAEESAPVATVADPTVETVTTSEARPAEDPNPIEEIEMDANEFRSVLGEMLGPIQQRLDRVEADQAAARAEVVEEPTTEDSPELIELRAKLAAAEAAREQAEAQRARDEKLIQTLSDQPARRTRAYRGSVHTGMEIEGGDFTQAIREARAEGQTPAIVRVCEKNSALTRLRALEDDDDNDYTPAKVQRDMRKALSALLAAADADGVLNKPEWA